MSYQQYGYAAPPTGYAGQPGQAIAPGQPGAAYGQQAAYGYVQQQQQQPQQQAPPGYYNPANPQAAYQQPGAPVYQQAAPAGYQQAGAYQQGGVAFQQAAYQPAAPGVQQEVMAWFSAVDVDRNGRISAEELQRALMNTNWTPFEISTCRLLLNTFDARRLGTIDINEFAALHKHVADWKRCFDSFDRDRSGSIDGGELQTAFRGFGYQLSPDFSRIIVQRFDSPARRGVVQFDRFIFVCALLKSLTDKFASRDTSRTGMIQIGYEDFLRIFFETAIV